MQVGGRAHSSVKNPAHCDHGRRGSQAINRHIRDAQLDQFREGHATDATRAYQDTNSTRAWIFWSISGLLVLDDTWKSPLSQQQTAV